MIRSEMIERLMEYGWKRAVLEELADDGLRRMMERYFGTL